MKKKINLMWQKHFCDICQLLHMLKEISKKNEKFCENKNQYVVLPHYLCLPNLHYCQIKYQNQPINLRT